MSKKTTTDRPTLYVTPGERAKLTRAEIAARRRAFYGPNQTRGPNKTSGLSLRRAKLRAQALHLKGRDQ